MNRPLKRHFHSLATLFILAGALLVVPASEAQTGTLFVENGNVGISEENPAHALHIVRSDGTAEVVVEELSGSTQNRNLFSLINNGGPQFLVTNTNSGQSWRFHTGGGRFNISLGGSGVDEFKVLPGGNVEIAGSLTTSGGSYPDYVFEDSYDLLPLAELGEFIELHGHLPNIPTAEDTDDGRRINITQLQIKTLEKVEELTLYTLQQEKKLERQEKLIASLLERLEALEDGSELP